MQSFVDELIIVEIFVIIVLFFSLFIHKSVAINSKRKAVLLEQEIAPKIDAIVEKLQSGVSVHELDINQIKKAKKNRIQRQIISDRIVEYLGNKDRPFGENVVALCENLGFVDDEIRHLMSNDNLVKAEAAKLLGEYRSRKAVTALVKEIVDDSDMLEYNILLALSRIGDADALIKAFNHLNSESEFSFHALVEIIDQFNGDKNILYPQMIKHKSEYVAIAFIRSAGQNKCYKIDNEIAEYLQHESKELRISAIKFLGEVGESKWVEDIANLLEDPEWEVRAIVIRIIGNLSPNTSVNKKLINALNDDQWYVKNYAGASLLKTKEGIKMLISNMSEASDDKKTEIALILSGHLTNVEDLQSNSELAKLSELISETLKTESGDE